MSNQSKTEFDALAKLADAIKDEYLSDEDPWQDSPFQWIKMIPPRKKGKLGEKLVAAWCAVNGLAIDTPKDSDADLLVNGNRVEIKLSTLWESGIYKFQQIRDQKYDLLVCLGISPHSGHCWVLNKEVLKKHVIGHRPQHGGKAGTDTFWLEVNPNHIEKWLAPYGGTLEDGFKILKDTKKK